MEKNLLIKLKDLGTTLQNKILFIFEKSLIKDLSLEAKTLLLIFFVGKDTLFIILFFELTK